MHSHTPPDGTPSTGSDESSYAQSLVADLRKDDNHLRQIFDSKALPPMMILLFVFSIETSVFSHAIIFGRADDLSLSNTHLSWLYAAPYILQTPLQFPIAWSFSDDFPLDAFAALVLCICDLLWHFMAGAGATGLLVGRLLQGVLEACILPQLVLKTQVYWCREEVPLRMGYWYSMAGLATIVLSISTHFLTFFPFKGSYPTLILNCTTAIFYLYTLWVIFFLGTSSITIKFLTDRDQKIAYGVKRLISRRNRDWSEGHVQLTKKDTKTWLWLALTFSASLLVSGINRLTPSILDSFGADSSRILLNVPFGAMQIVAIVGGSVAAMKRSIGHVIIALSLASAFGFIALAKDRGALGKSVLVGYYLTAAMHGVVPLIYSWYVVNTGGVTKQKATAALIFTGQLLGNVTGSILFTPSSGAILGYRILWTTAVAYLSVIGLAIVIRKHLHDLNTHVHPHEVHSMKEGFELGPDDRLDFAIDHERMQSSAGAHMLQDRGVPYLFRSSVFEDLTDLDDKRFRFIL